MSKQFEKEAIAALGKGFSAQNGVSDNDLWRIGLFG